MATKFSAELHGKEVLLAEIRGKLEAIKELPDIKVGVKDGVAYPDGTPVELVGTVHEYGSEARRIPERSYLRSTVHENRNEYLSILQKIADGAIQGAATKDTLAKLDLLGLLVENDVKKKIGSSSLTPLAEATLKMRKGNSSAPLSDTGLLRSSIIYETEVNSLAN